MERYDEIFLNGAVKYINDLQYVAKDNTKLLNSLFNLYIINNVYMWGNTFEIDKENIFHLKDIMNNIIYKNEDLDFKLIPQKNIHSHVNVPQKHYKNRLMTI